MSFVSFVKNIPLIVVTTALLINFYGHECDCSLTTKVAEYLGFPHLNKEQLFALLFAKAALLLMFCNYFAFKIAKRFLIENLFVIGTLYWLSKILEFRFGSLSTLFCLGLFSLITATFMEKCKMIKSGLFTVFVITNTFIFLVLSVPNFEMLLTFTKHQIGLN
ncbi:hypothetical protein ECANGB1_905 [Enterospora canceri]|uniref:Uncharacterized protein n=1 Tax=Enterospora canceri TaxID=1081671 RepID=A0A1Y1S771_9MICR|nr:hypothetical protein ECANGB1_905 [Enterospora canceri]